jgi:cytochrome c551/c552
MIARLLAKDAGGNGLGKFVLPLNYAIAAREGEAFIHQEAVDFIRPAFGKVAIDHQVLNGAESRSERTLGNAPAKNEVGHNGLQD